MQSNGSARDRAGKLFVGALAALSGAASMAAASSVLATPADDAALRASWREAIAQVRTPGEGGCFTADYPSLAWSKAACLAAPAVPLIPRGVRTDGGLSVGDGNDFAIRTNSLISTGVGSFPTVKGVTSETGQGKTNAYTLQLNSQFFNGPACAGAATPSKCRSWLQYVYFAGGGRGSVFMQYWLIDWNTTCPAGWNTFSVDCYKNSRAVAAPQEPITDLGQMAVTGSAVDGGLDTTIFTDGAKAYKTTGSDSVVHLAGAWNGAEFNVIGPGSGASANFNTGVKMTVAIAVDDGSTKKPQCVANGGTTGETNNLNLGACKAKAGDTPSIAFVQSN